MPFLILTGMSAGPHIATFDNVDLRFIQSAPLITCMGRLGIQYLLLYLGPEFWLGRLIEAERLFLASRDSLTSWQG